MDLELIGLDFDGKRGPQIVQELESNYFTSPSKQNSTDTTIPLIRGYNREREKQMRWLAVF